MTISKWINLTQVAGAQWDLEIYSAADKCECGNNDEVFRQEIRNIGQHISLKHEVIKVLSERIAKEHTQLLTLIDAHTSSHVSTKSHEGYAFDVDDELKYQLISDIESLIYQLLSCWQITKKFVLKIRQHLGTNRYRKQINHEIETILSKQQDISWISSLTNYRDFVAHMGGIYLAVDVSSTNTSDWDLLILKTIVQDFNSKDEYFTFSEIKIIFEGFVEASGILKTELLNTLKENNK